MTSHSPRRRDGRSREALIDAGVALIAERGFDSVTVGEIEEGAGFVARGGTLYKHFASKHALMVAAVQRHVASLDRFDDLERPTPLPDLRSELIVLARWILRRLDAEALVSRVIEKEGHRLPEVVAEMREGVSEAGYRALAEFMRARGAAATADTEAMAVMLLGALINLRRSTWTFGQPPTGIDDDRAAHTWAGIVLTVIRAPDTQLQAASGSPDS